MNIEVHYAKNTGFNKMNRPSRPEMVEMYVADAIWVLQDKILPKIRVEQTFEEVQGWDYVRINSTYYFVTDVKMLNLNVAEIYLELDALSTIGVANIDVISGWCVRRHVNDDTPFSNTLPENFTPSEQLVEDIDTFSLDDQGGYTIVTATTDLDYDNIQNIAKTFTDLDTQSSVTVPIIEKIVDETTFELYLTKEDGTHYIKKIPNLSAFIFKIDSGIVTRVAECVRILRSLGLSEVITGCYFVPYCSVDVDDENPTRITRIYQYGDIQKNFLNLPYKWTDVKNNKVYAGQYNVYSLHSQTSGDMQEFLANDLYASGEDYPKITVIVDPSPNGKMYARPLYYRGVEVSGQNFFINSVTSLPWENTPLTFTGAEGTALTTYEYGWNKRNMSSKLMKDMVDSGLNTANSLLQPFLINQPTQVLSATANAVGTTIQEGVNSVYNIAKYNTDSNYNLNQLNINNNLQPPQTFFPISESLQNYLGYSFTLIRTRLSDNDTQRYDKYLTMYGYRVNEPMTNECFTGRKYFNYVGCEDLNISVPDTIPIYIREMAVADLENGVRLWHVKPNKQYFNDNPIV